jgi:lysophospholipase L1-like esterase
MKMIMKKHVFIFFIAVIFILILPVTANAQEEVIVLYGDSMFTNDTLIPADVVALRAGDFVIERGHGGWTSSSGKRHFKGEVVSFKPTVVVIDFGINDAIRNGNHNRVSLSQYKKNLKKMIKKSIEIGAMVVVVTPGPVNYAQRGGSWKDSEVNAYREAAISIASEYGALVVDAYALLINTGDYLAYLQSDGLHYNEAGSKLIADQINLTINSLR